MKARALCVVVLVLSFGAGFLNAESERRDGNWWNEQEKLTKLSYVVGFFDGMDLGKSFSIWKLIGDPCLTKASISFSEFIEKYLKNVSSGQLADGLDEFYKDYRNRAILVSNGVWIVLKSISGTPKDELEKIIENFRRYGR